MWRETVRYLKIILTVIAFLLAVQAAARLIPGARAGGAVDVNIVEVGGKNIYIPSTVTGGVPVVIKK
jgi:hypothetical protein